MSYLLDHAPASSVEQRVKAQVAVESARVDLRYALLQRYRALYLEQLSDSAAARAAGLSDEEIALLDLELDPHCRTLDLGGRAARRAFDRAVWQSVGANLRLLRVKISRLAETWDRGDAESMLLDALTRTVERWDPDRGSLAAALDCQIRSQIRDRTRYARRYRSEVFHAERSTRVPLRRGGSDVLFADELESVGRGDGGCAERACEARLVLGEVEAQLERFAPRDRQLLLASHSPEGIDPLLADGSRTRAAALKRLRLLRARLRERLAA